MNCVHWNKESKRFKKYVLKEDAIDPLNMGNLKHHRRILFRPNARSDMTLSSVKILVVDDHHPTLRQWQSDAARNVSLKS